MMNEKKSPVQKFLEGKGFYIALALCVAGTGTAAWLAVNRTIDDIDDQNQKILESRPQTEDFTNPGEVDAEQNGVTISSEGEDSSSDASSSQEPAAQPSGGSASSVPQNTSALQFSLPVAGEKLNPYSDGKLVKDATLGEWRTHDGLDLKAAKGTPVYAAAEGTVASVKEDGLWGTVITIDHRMASPLSTAALRTPLSMRGTKWLPGNRSAQWVRSPVNFRWRIISTLRCRRTANGWTRSPRWVWPDPQYKKQGTRKKFFRVPLLFKPMARCILRLFLGGYLIGRNLFLRLIFRTRGRLGDVLIQIAGYFLGFGAGLLFGAALLRAGLLSLAAGLFRGGRRTILSIVGARCYSQSHHKSHCYNR